MPLQHRHGYAADLHRGLPTDDINQPRSSPHRSADAHCSPAQIRQIRAGGLLLRGVQTLVSLVHLPVSLAGPRPSGSAGPSRRCQGCCPPSPSSQGSGCPQLQPARCDEPMAVSFHHRKVQERLVALEIGDPQPVRSAWRERTANEIRDRVPVGPGDRGPTAAANAPASHAMQAHQAPHPLDVDLDAGVAEFAMHAGRSCRRRRRSSHASS